MRAIAYCRETLRRRDHVVLIAREREHAATVIDIRRAVQEHDARRRPDGVRAGVDDLDPAALTQIRYAFHGRLHGRSLRAPSEGRDRGEPLRSA